MNKEILDFVQSEPVCAIALILPDGSPHNATLHHAHALDPFCLIFETNDESRKFSAFSYGNSARASVVIGVNENDFRTLQLNGLATRIDKNDPKVSKVMPFNGVEIEYIFVEKRIYEEMIIFRGDDEKYAGIRWDLEKQELIFDQDKPYDKLIFNIVGFTDQVWDELTSRFEEIQKNGKVELMSELDTYRQSKALRLTREFYFDISSFYGQ